MTTIAIGSLVGYILNRALKGLITIKRIYMPITLAFFGKVEQHIHLHTNDKEFLDAAIDRLSIGSTSSGTGSPAESGAVEVGAGDRTASGNEKSATADGLP
jgi:hypothetical protein